MSDFGVFTDQTDSMSSLGIVPSLIYSDGGACLSGNRERRLSRVEPTITIGDHGTFGYFSLEFCGSNILQPTPLLQLQRRT